MEWKECHPGYLISSDGSCKRISHIITRKDGIKMRLREREMIGSLDSGGYLIYTFSQVAYLAHRVVAKAFIPNPKNLPCVNHKNGVKTDNRAENLEWVTYSQNHQHAYDSLGRKGYWTGKTGKSNRLSKPVRKLDISGNEIARYDSAKEASIQHGKHPLSVSKAIRQNYRVAGHFWEYIKK